MLCRPPNHCLKPPSACTLARSHGMGSALSPCPAFLSPTFSLYPLAVSPCLKGLWEERGLFSSSEKSMQPILPQNRLAISRVPAGKGCGPITQTMPSASLLWIKTRLGNVLAIKTAQSPGLCKGSQSARSDTPQTDQIMTFICENLHTSSCQSRSLTGSLDQHMEQAVTYQKLLPCALDEIQVKQNTQLKFIALGNPKPD